MTHDRRLDLARACLRERFHISDADVRICPWRAGGQSIVYRAELSEQPTVCIKTARESNIHIQREADLLQAISGPFPNLLFDGSADGFIIEEFVNAPSFTDLNLVRLRQELPRIVRGLASALNAFASHPLVILHRDIKPAHIKLTDRGLVLLDFGSAEFEGQRKNDMLRGCVIKLGRGTHIYQPPEQLMRFPTQDRRVDVFAAAAVVATVVGGRPPYDNLGDDAEDTLRRYHEQEAGLFVFLKHTDGPLRDALMKALKIAPEDRSKTLSPVLEALNVSEGVRL